jgi:hypothetical protein
VAQRESKDQSDKENWLQGAREAEAVAADVVGYLQQALDAVNRAGQRLREFRHICCPWRGDDGRSPGERTGQAVRLMAERCHLLSLTEAGLWARLVRLGGPVREEGGRG